MSKTEEGLYEALEAELKKSADPMDCVMLFEKASVRKHANTVGRVSDYLGNMWRRGDVVRLPAPRLDNSRSRWMYMWKGRRPAPMPAPEDAVEFDTKKVLLQRPTIEISEAGKNLVIETPATSSPSSNADRR